MNEQHIDIPCPVCSAVGNVKMMSHIDEIPYFGEHTQVTLLCDDCGWRQTDFIPAEGKKAGSWSIVIDDEEKLRARVVRSSSCTVRLPELDLLVNPGSSATGYVSNVEGVLQRFLEVIRMVERDVVEELNHATEGDIPGFTEQLATLQNMKLAIEHLGTPNGEALTLELLDPHGHSMILHDDAVERELLHDEMATLPVGPDPAVFSSEDLDGSP
ncbi:MAG: ZPR1 zinc finger domain-containing protein [Candidatus Poseidonia sp.]|jgi:zinc finger protein|nr:ZPR1 zinc finger domain-containing protein [Poseidonia sp.]